MEIIYLKQYRAVKAIRTRGSEKSRDALGGTVDLGHRLEVKNMT